MAIKGSLREAGLPDVIQLLSMGRKTGILTVTEKDHFGSITFYKGKIVDSYLINRKNRIGDMLVASGEMSEEQLLEALKIQEKTGGKIGTILLREQFVREESILRFLRQQIKETIFIMMTWENGYFNFEARYSGIEGEIIAIEPESLLLESAKKVDELSVVELEILRDSSTLKAMQPQDSVVTLSNEEKKVHCLLDGEKTLELVIESSPFDKFDTKEIVSALIQKGYCSIVEGVSTQSVKEKINEHLNLGIAFLKTQLYDEAEREFKHILSLDPQSNTAKFYLSVVQMHIRNWKEAEDLLNQLRKDFPDNPVFLNNLGFILVSIGDEDKALEYFEEASRIELNGIPFVNIGIVYFKKADFHKSKDYFMKALGVDGNLMLPHFYLSLIEALSGNFKEAEREIRYMIKVNPEIPVLHYNLGVVLEKLGSFEQAEGGYKKALSIEPNYIEARLSLGELYYRLGLYPQARKSFEMLTEAGLGNAPVFLKLGNIHLKMGQKERALEEWKKALRLEPDNDVVRKNIEMLDNVERRNE